jgi:hypothetical protein
MERALLLGMILAIVPLAALATSASTPGQTKIPVVYWDCVSASKITCQPPPAANLPAVITCSGLRSCLRPPLAIRVERIPVFMGGGITAVRDLRPIRIPTNITTGIPVIKISGERK